MFRLQSTSNTKQLVSSIQRPDGSVTTGDMEITNVLH